MADLNVERVQSLTAPYLPFCDLARADETAAVAILDAWISGQPIALYDVGTPLDPKPGAWIMTHVEVLRPQEIYALEIPA